MARLPYHVDGIHDGVAAAIAVSIRDAQASDGPSPIGLVLQGQKGIGKTHLLGLVRRQTHRDDGYFFLDDLTAPHAFWENTADALRSGLSQPDQSGEPQVRSFVRRICQRGSIDPVAAKKLMSGHGVAKKHVDAFVTGLWALDRQVADGLRRDRTSARAPGDRGSGGESCRRLLPAGSEELERGERRKWGIRPAPKPRSDTGPRLTRLLALTGPIVIGSTSSTR